MKGKEIKQYGFGNTIHKTAQLDIEVFEGKVVSAWFRCMILPFNVVEVDKSRAEELDLMNRTSTIEIHGINYTS